MNRLLVILVSVLAPTLAAAQEATIEMPSWARIELPDGYRLAERDSRAQAAGTPAAEQLGGTATLAGARVHRGPAGLALVIEWAEAAPEGVPVEATESVVRAELDGLRRAPEVTLEPPTSRLLAWREDIDEAVAVGDIEWRNDAAGTHQHARILLYRVEGGPLRKITAECIATAEVGDQDRAGCEAAVASLGITTPADERAGLGGLRAGPDAPAAGPETAADELPPASAPPPPRMGPASGVPGVLVSRPPPDKKKDHQWMMLGGIVLLVVAGYLILRGRREERAEPPPEQP